MSLNDLDGSGTEDDPYILTDVEDLKLLKEGDEDHFALGNNINASETEDWNDGLGLEPPDGEEKNVISFDGRNNTIRNLHILRPYNTDVNTVSFLGKVKEVRDLELLNVEISGGNIVGGIASRAYGDITNCRVTGEISSRDQTIGGIAAVYQRTNEPATDLYDVSGVYEERESVERIEISDCEVDATIYSGDSEAGAIVGRMTKRAKISNCHADGEIVTGLQMGGIVGNSKAQVFSDPEEEDGDEKLETPVVEKCYFTGSIVTTGSSGATHTPNNRGIGGLAGYSSGIIRMCYATSDVVSDTEFTGGFVGNCSGITKDCFSMGYVEGGGITGGFMAKALVNDYHPMEVERCYFVGYVESNENANEVDSDSVGSFVGEGDEGIVNCYWDTDNTTTKISDTHVNGFDDYSEGIPEDEMTGSSAEENMEGFDFDDVWSISPSYPSLRVEIFPISQSMIGLVVTVSEFDGEPIEDQSIYIGSNNLGRTDEDGILSTEIPDIDEGEVAWANQGVTQEVEFSEVKTEVDFRTALVEGTITDVNGDPVEGDAVLFDDQFLFRTDEDGRYEAKSIPPGQFEFSWPSGGVEQSIDIEDGGEESFDFQYAGVKVEVKQPFTGEPISNAVVDINSSVQLTDEDGVVELTELPIDEYTITVMGFWDAETGQLSEGEFYEEEFSGENMELSIGVDVIAQQDSTPIQDVDVRVTGTGVRGRTDENGHAELFTDEVDRNPRVVVASNDNRYNTQMELIDPTEPRHDLTFSLIHRDPMRR